MRFVYEAPLRWSDLDVFGHVNNALFLTLYEEARVALFFVAARQAGLTSFEEGIVIARHEIDYLRQVDHSAHPDGTARPAQVRIEMWVEEIRPSRFTLAYEMHDGGVIASRARSVCVPFDLANKRPRRLSESERTFLDGWLAPT
jgi:acyl-CoA thioester hydrolase